VLAVLLRVMSREYVSKAVRAPTEHRDLGCHRCADGCGMLPLLTR